MRNAIRSKEGVAMHLFSCLTVLYITVVQRYRDGVCSLVFHLFFIICDRYIPLHDSVCIAVGSTVVRVGVSADVEALSLTGAENTEHWTDGDCIGCSTALPSPTVPASDDETTQTLDLILHHTKLPPYLN